MSNPAISPLSAPTAYDSLVQSICAQNFPIRGEQLTIGGMDLAEVIRTHGTPFYAYDAATIRHRVGALLTALPGFDCHYSIKANPNPSIVTLLLELGCGMEVASDGEVQLALLCGCSRSKIIFAGPGKTPYEIERAVDAEISDIHVESFGEIRTLAAIARARGKIVPVSLRINPKLAAAGASQQMGGKATAFGIDEERLAEAVAAVQREKSLRLSGLHVYAGTQNLNAASFQALYRQIFGLAEEVCRLTGEPLGTLDFGGGFGVPYFSGDTPLDLESLRQIIGALVAEFRSKAGLVHTRLVVEPGRFLVAESGVYVARVTDIKESRGTRFAVLDGGMNHHLPASGQFGQIVKRNFPIVVANKVLEAPTTPYELVGPLCTPLDVVGRSVVLPTLEVGDAIAILQSGAYARTTSPLGFLSHYDPLELLAESGSIRVIRERGSINDIVRGTSFAKTVQSGAKLDKNSSGASRRSEPHL